MDPYIKKCRDVALDHLKPSRADLEHGLALHADALVWDSYGFSPRSSVDGEVVQQAARAGACREELRDLMEWSTMTGCATPGKEREDYLEAWREAGVTCVFQNAGMESPVVERLARRLGHYTYVTDALKGRVDKAVTPADVLRAHEQRRHCLCFAGNAVPLRRGFRDVESELGMIRVFFQLGVRMMHLTYNRRNLIGDGCAETTDAGLSDFGRAVVREMNRVGVIVDTAHSGWQTTLDAAAESDRPMVISHAACWAVHRHVRCKSDEVMRAVADTGGFAGICCMPAFLGGGGDIRALLDHIEHAVKTVGPEHVAVGTDRAYRSPGALRSLRHVPSGPARPGFENFWPADDPIWDAQWDRKEQGMSLSWTNWPLITVGLVQRGYKDDDIRAILGGNVMRVARAALETSEGRPLLDRESPT